MLHIQAQECSLKFIKKICQIQIEDALFFILDVTFHATEGTSQ